MASRRIFLGDERGNLHEAITAPDGVTLSDTHVTVRRIRPGELRVGKHSVWVAHRADQRWVFLNGRTYVFDIRRDGPMRKRAAHDDTLSSPMPATVIKLQVAAGDTVRAGQVLLVLEAMKMELPVRATGDARVKAVLCREGELVQPGQTLIDLEPLSESGEEPAR
jgi:biotin carboxyl carrier protein